MNLIVFNNRNTTQSCFYNKCSCSTIYRSDTHDTLWKSVFLIGRRIVFVRRTPYHFKMTTHFINLLTGIFMHFDLIEIWSKRRLKMFLFSVRHTCERYVGIRFVIKICWWVFLNVLLDKFDDPFAFIIVFVYGTFKVELKK